MGPTTRGSWPWRRAIVAMWGREPSALRVSRFPQEAEHLAFKKCEIRPFLNVGPNSLQTLCRPNQTVRWLNPACRAAGLQSLMEEAEIRCGKGRLTFFCFNLRDRLVPRSQMGKLRPISVRSHHSSSST